MTTPFVLTFSLVHLCLTPGNSESQASQNAMAFTKTGCECQPYFLYDISDWFSWLLKPSVPRHEGRCMLYLCRLAGTLVLVCLTTLILKVGTWKLAVLDGWRRNFTNSTNNMSNSWLSMICGTEEVCCRNLGMF